MSAKIRVQNQTINTNPKPTPHRPKTFHRLKLPDRRRDTPESAQTRSESLCASLWVPCRIFWAWFCPTLGQIRIEVEDPRPDPKKCSSSVTLADCGCQAMKDFRMQSPPANLKDVLNDCDAAGDLSMKASCSTVLQLVGTKLSSVVFFVFSSLFLGIYFDFNPSLPSH